VARKPRRRETLRPIPDGVREWSTTTLHSFRFLHETQALIAHGLSQRLLPSELLTLWPLLLPDIIDIMAPKAAADTRLLWDWRAVDVGPPPSGGIFMPTIAVAAGREA
jgi:hypothetical protein